MANPLICMTLTGRTLEEDALLTKKYEDKIDLVELRVDCLDEDEQLIVKKFPSMISKPCILTIRRDIDGGKFTGSEFSRINLFARALAFANQDRSKNFAYVDFEEDFHIPSIQDAALAFDVKIIRSVHNMTGPILNLKERCDNMRKTGYEIPKIAFMPSCLNDVLNMFNEGQKIEYDHIFCAMGPIGFPSRILSERSNSYLSFTSPQETLVNVQGIGHMDPVTLSDLYRFHSINKETKLYGITGWPLVKTLSPELHNQGYIGHNMNAVYLPFRTPEVSEAVNMANNLDIRGMSVTIPHKEAVMDYMDRLSPEAYDIGAVNTIVKEDNLWTGYNTDAGGFRRALEEFTGLKKLKHFRVAIIGAGGAAKAIAWVIKQMGGKACVFNRTLASAKDLAEKYGFAYAELSPESDKKLSEYSDIIIQTTSVGMNSTEPSSSANDPIYFHSFKGTEMIMDIIYTPEETPIIKRAAEAGCKTCNGLPMLKYQGYMQFKLFTGVDYENA